MNMRTYMFRHMHLLLFSHSSKDNMNVSIVLTRPNQIQNIIQTILTLQELLDDSQTCASNGNCNHGVQPWYRVHPQFLRRCGNNVHQ